MDGMTRRPDLGRTIHSAGLKVPKFDGSNFTDWKYQMECYLYTVGLHDVVTSAEVCNAYPSRARAAHAILSLSVSSKLVYLIRDVKWVTLTVCGRPYIQCMSRLLLLTC